jgi:cytosine/adenosine deaminase-related metal-dependent hydrolase
MLLLNARQYGKEGLWNLLIGEGGSVSVLNASQVPKQTGFVIDAKGALLLPGLVNSHEHLDFNCYPQLGNRKYQNYREWGTEIHREYKEEIGKVKRIPPDLRVQWGMYKNLLNGFTTVVNHGEELKIEDPFIRVIQRYPPIHSVGFEKSWKRKLRNPFLNRMLVMHIGEGVDEIASKEIAEVISANIFRKKIVAVHGIAMSSQEAKFFRGLVWCPASNYFLFEKTADIPSLLGKIAIVFGTDSTLSAPWNAWSQFRQAIKDGRVTEEALLDMLTARANELWSPGDETRDLVLVRSHPQIFEADPSDILLVTRRGRVCLIDEELSIGTALNSYGFSRIRMGGSIKQVWGDLPSLAKKIRSFFPELEIPFVME